MCHAQLRCLSSSATPESPRRAVKGSLALAILVDFRTEDQDGMCNALQVRWTITPTTAPQPWIICSGCGGLRAFQSSDKIRLNANGRKLDAWLIYKCTTLRQDVEPDDLRTPECSRHRVRLALEALQSNDPDWIRAEAFNLEALRRASRRIDEFADLDIRKELVRETPGWTHLKIEFSISLPISARLDRVLASELQVSRSQLSAFHEARLLRTDPDRTGVLRRRIPNGLRVAIDLSDLHGREVVWKPLAIGKDV